MTDYRSHQNDHAVSHSEDPAFPPLVAVDLRRAGAVINQPYMNLVVFNVNDHCVRLAVMEGEFRWHHHPRSDECFLVLEGELEIDLADGRLVRLTPGQAFCIPAGVVHRTRSFGRSMNLCFEDRAAYVDVVFTDSIGLEPA